MEEVNDEDLNTLEHTWHKKFKKQDQELIAWLNEFLDSEEYAEILKQRAELVEKDEPIENTEQQESVLESLENLRVDSSVKEKLVVLGEKIKDTLTKFKVNNTIRNQWAGIEIIREKISECKLEHAQYLERQRIKAFKDHRFALELLSQKYSLRLDEISPAIIQKFINQREKQRKREQKILKNKMTIIAKFAKDMSIDRRIKKKARKVVRKIRSQATTSDFKETIHYLSLISDEEEAESKATIPEGPEDFFEEESVVSTPPPLEIEKDKKGKGKGKKDKEKKGKDKKEKGKGKDKQKKAKGKDSSKKSDKSSKKVKKQTSVEGLIIPENIPNPNERKKISPEYNLSELLDDFKKLSAYLKDRKHFDMTNYLSDQVYLPVDTGFFCNPDKIIFKNFQPGRIYKKHISIVNGNPTIRKIRFDRIIWHSDIEEDVLLDIIEPFGICKVLPGMNVRICLKFTPEVLNRTTNGKIIFLTNVYNSKRIYQFIMNIICVPLCAAVTISPNIISFEEMPIWRAQKLRHQGLNYKTVTINNAGLKECKVVITKVFNDEVVEQDWKRIISIIQVEVDDIPSNDKKQLSSSTLEDPYAADTFPRNLVQQCVENVFNVFKFERNIFVVEPQSTKTIKCWFKDINEAGYQVETYIFSFYERFADGQLYCIGTQDVIVHSETTSHILQCSLEILDYEVCVYGFIYQLSFELTNPCKLSHHIQICFPSAMKPYLKANMGATTILPNETVTIYLKFMPWQGILTNNKFYDSELGFLEFPVYVFLQTHGYEDNPPLKIDVFAVVTEAQGVTIALMEPMLIDLVNNEYFNELGTCSSLESVYVDIEVQNSSLVPQHFGFLNVPKFVSIEPNFGFGKLAPMQKTTVRIVVSPSKQDVMDTNGTLLFQIMVSTLKYCGITKKRINNRDILKKLKQMEEFLSNCSGDSNTELEEDIQILRTSLQKSSTHSFPKSNTSANRLLQTLDSTEHVVNVTTYVLEEEKSENTTEYTIPVETNNQMLQFKLNIFDPIVEVSHQLLNFPDTPCGSFSYMNIDLTTLKISHFKYIATFEIFGSTDEIEVQPSFNDLLPGSKRDIWILVKPKVPQNVIEERAVALRTAKFNEEKLQKEQEEEEKRSKEIEDIENIPIPKKDKDPAKKSKGSKKESKKGSKKDSKKKEPKRESKRESKVSEQLVAFDETAVGYDDYYQAEMDVWRQIEPYLLENLFTCCVTYKDMRNKLLDWPQERLFIKTTCLVVPPNFIHDQKYQVVDFGKVVLGMSVTKIISFQNIQRRSIIIETSPTNPVGPFSSSAGTKSAPIPAEFLYTYPITFRPTEEKIVSEYLNATSEHTSYLFILKGLGIKPNVIFTPNFTICRITATYGSYADCTFDIENECDGIIEIQLNKVCEIEGKIYNDIKLEESKDKKQKKEKKQKTKETKAEKEATFSDELYSYEENCMQQFFEPREEPTKFHVLSNTEIENVYRLEANSKGTIKIRFGDWTNDIVTTDEKEIVKKEKRKSSRKSRSSKITNSPREETNKYYIAKYNIFLGLEYLKDIIIISSYE